MALIAPFLAKLQDLKHVIPSADEDLCLFAKLFIESREKNNYGTSPGSFGWDITALASTLRASPKQFGAEYQRLKGKHWTEYEALCNRLADAILIVIPDGTLTVLETRSGRVGLGIQTNHWHFDFTPLAREYRAQHPIHVSGGLGAG